MDVGTSIIKFLFAPLHPSLSRYIRSVYFPYAAPHGGNTQWSHMARTVRNPKIDTRSARAKLPLRAEPYWTVISEGCALGYRRGAKGGTWVARFRGETGKQHYGALGR